MNKFSWKPLLPHIIAVAVFLVVALIYCKPALEGNVLQQGDVTQWKGMSKDAYNYKEKHGEMPLWTNGMFSGMPTYQIATKANSYVPYYAHQALSLFLPKPVNFFFLACICFYILCVVALRINPYVAIAGALAYAYATYNPIIVAAGHDTKMQAIALLPGVIAGLLLIYEKRYWLGAALTAVFVAMQINVNHMQITYYTLIISFVMSIAFAIRWIQQKEWKHLAMAAVFALVSGLVGVLSNAVMMFTTYEYAKETIRGGSQLADGKGNLTKEGLSTTYALDYSMFPAEPLVLMFPKMYGGSSSELEVEEDKSKAIEALQTMPQQMGQQLQGYLSFYWGGIKGVGTAGPPYTGAIICVLALIGFAVLSNKHKWWILATIVLAVVMSWGEYFKSFNVFLLENLPMYNKFRAPSMIMVIPTFLLCMLAMLTLNKLLFAAEDTAAFKKRFKTGLLIAAGAFVVALLIYISFDYTGLPEKEVLKQVANAEPQVQDSVKSFFNGLKEDRQSLFLSSILRSFLFGGIAVAVLWFLMKRSIKPVIALAAIGIFAFADVMAVNTKYLNAENYQVAEEYDQSFTPTEADNQIMQDKSYYRVLDLRRGISNAFNGGALTSYFHKNIGGYHPAKLSLYQDLIENKLYNFPNCMPIINMLNTKYIITEQGQVYNNAAEVLGAVWFVKTIKWVNTPKEEMDALTPTFGIRDTVIVQKKFENVGNKPFAFDSSAKIELVKNDNDIVTYRSSAKSAQFAVFSEVYYDKGWNAYIDNQRADFVKANYVLRAMPIPAGDHTIEFRFEPQSHKIGSMVTTICSVLLLVLLAFGIWKTYKHKEMVVVEKK
jgi:hypothetical protein